MQASLLSHLMMGFYTYGPLDTILKLGHKVFLLLFLFNYSCFPYFFNFFLKSYIQTKSQTYSLLTFPVVYEGGTVEEQPVGALCNIFVSIHSLSIHSLLYSLYLYISVSAYAFLLTALVQTRRAIPADPQCLLLDCEHSLSATNQRSSSP